MVDDYLDVSATRRPAPTRVRGLPGGKMAGPIVCLLATLESAGRHDTAELVSRRLAADAVRTAPDYTAPNNAAPADATWDWLMALMHESDVPSTLRSDLRHQAEMLRRHEFGARRPVRATASQDSSI